MRSARVFLVASALLGCGADTREQAADRHLHDVLAAVGSKDFSVANAHLQRALRLAPGSPRAKAIKEAFLEARWASVNGCLDDAIHAIRRGALDEAREHLDRGERHHPGSGEVLLLRQKLVRLESMDSLDQVRSGRGRVGWARIATLRLHEALEVSTAIDPDWLAELRVALARRVTIDVTDVAVQEALGALRREGVPIDLSVGPSRDVGLVSLRLRGTPAIEVLGLLAHQSELVVTLRGDRLFLADRW